MRSLIVMLVPALLSVGSLLQQPASEPKWLPEIEVSDVSAAGSAEAPAVEAVEVAAVEVSDEVPPLAVVPDNPAAARAPMPLVSTPSLRPIPEDSIPHLTRDDLQCVDDNMAKLLASSESQSITLNNLTADLAAKIAEMNKAAPECTCTCNCPTVDEIADAVEARIRPLLIVKNEAVGSSRKIAVSPDAPFELAPGEVLSGYERIPGSGIVQSVRSMGTASVPGVVQTVNRYEIDGWEVRTAPKANGGAVGQVRQAVRQTCQQVWNPQLNRFERRCSQ